MLNLSIKVFPLKYYIHHFILSRLRKSAHLVHVRMNEYVHFAEGQMFLTTYAGMSIRKKNLSDTLTLCTRLNLSIKVFPLKYYTILL
jgi:hypothetical protein